MLRVLDLFSGIGGFSLGLERAGPFRTVAFCERESFPQAVLRKHWPEVPIYDDVRTIPTERLGRIDLICGGFPCQPWSVAGEQRGAEDDRDLWPVMASLIEKLRPRWVVGENVRGFVNEPMGLERSLSDLEGFGYQAAPFVVPACAVDAPHRRDRVWIVAHAENAGLEGHGITCGAGKVSGKGRDVAPHGGGGIFADANLHEQQLLCGVERRKEEHAKFGFGGENVPNPDSGRPAKPGMGGVGDGVPAWLDEPDCGRVATGVKNRVGRLKTLGNAVVPQVVEQIGRAILAAEEST